MSAYVIAVGPFFSPAADAIIEKGCDEIERKVATAAHARLEILMRAFFRNPRPWYWTQVRHQPRADYWVVTDGGIVYGPWLEGTGSRNKETRFKGYRHWRTTTQSMNHEATLRYITDPVVTDMCRGLN